MPNRTIPATFSLFITLLALLVMGCDRSRCEQDDVDCGQFGNCIDLSDETSCLCTAGYEKDAEGRCEIKQVTKFLGTWRARDIREVNGSTRSLVYEIEIEEQADNITGIVIDNFANLTLTDQAGNTLCEPRLLGFVGLRTISIAGVTDGFSYCDAQGADLNFSGYRFRDAVGQFNTTQDTIFMDYELSYTLDNENGEPETTSIVSDLTLTRP
jgi:hypothetical protein